MFKTRKSSTSLRSFFDGQRRECQTSTDWTANNVNIRGFLKSRGQDDPRPVFNLDSVDGPLDGVLDGVREVLGKVDMEARVLLPGCVKCRESGADRNGRALPHLLDVWDSEASKLLASSRFDNFECSEL